MLAWTLSRREKSLALPRAKPQLQCFLGPWSSYYTNYTRPAPIIYKYEYNDTNTKVPTDGWREKKGLL
jgi:hypothetical protein